MTPLRPVLDADELRQAADYTRLGPLLAYLTLLERYADSLEAHEVESQRQLWMPPSLTGGSL